MLFPESRKEEEIRKFQKTEFALLSEYSDLLASESLQRRRGGLLLY